MAINVSALSEIASLHEGSSGSRSKASLMTKNRGVDGDSVEIGNRELIRAEVAEVKQASREVSEGRNALRQAETAAQSIADNLVLMQNLAVRAKAGGLTQQQRRELQGEYGRLSAADQQTGSGSDLQGEKVIGFTLKAVLYDPTKVMDNMRDEMEKFSVSDGNKVDLEGREATKLVEDIVDDPGKVVGTLEREIAEVGGLIASIEAAGKSLDTVADAIDGAVEDILRPELRIDDIKTAAEIAQGTADNIEADSAEAAQAQGDSVTAAVAALLS